MAGKYLPRRLWNAFSELGDPSERLRALLAANSPEYVYYFDDFVGDSAGTWPADANWGYPATAGTGTEVIALEAAAGGVLGMTTGASANDSAGQGVGLHWSGDAGFYYICRAKIDNITSSKFELGVSSAVTGDTGAVATKATPTFTAATFAGFVFDTADDTEVTFVSSGGTPADNDVDATAFDLANDTYFIVEVVGGGPTATTGDNVSGYINGKFIGGGFIAGATLVTPWMYVETNTTATRKLSVDYQGMIGRRV